MSTASRPPMTDRALVGTKYRSYKNATDKLAGWLASTVSLEIGHYTPSVPTHNGPAHGLTVAQFSQLTDLIVDHAPRIEVPLDIVSTAEKAYLFRQECTSVLQGVDTESDKRHQYVASVIGDVFKKLSSHSRALKQGMKQDAKPKVGLDLPQENNAVPSFQLLDIESMESSDDDSHEQRAALERQARNKSRNRKKKMLKKKKKAKEPGKHAYLLDEEEDPYFVLMCLLSDLKSMRDYIKEVWLEYKEGKLDLITASLTANATFDIIRTYEKDFPAISSLLSDYSQAVKLILSRNLDQSDEGLELFFKPCTTLSEVNMGDIRTIGKSLSSIPQVAELIFANAFYFLSGPRHVMVQKKRAGWNTVWPKKGKWEDMQTIDVSINPFGNGQTGQAEDGLAPEERLREDIQILASFAKHVYVFKGEDREFCKSTYDHFTLQWRHEFAKTGDKTVTLAQAFGAQTYLDMHHTLREDAKRGVLDLFKASLRMVHSVACWRSSTPQNLSEDKELRQGVINLQHTMASLGAGLMEEMLELLGLGCDSRFSEILEMGDDVIEEALKAFPFLRLNPILCGIVLFDATHSFRDEGTYFSQYLYYPVFAGQIYYGCQLQRKFWKTATDLDKKGHIFKRQINQRWKDPLEWKDMDYLFDMFGPEVFFEGMLPRSNSDLVNYYGPLEDLIITSKWWSDRVERKLEGHFGPLLSAPALGEDGSARKVQFSKLIYNFQPVLVTHQLYYSKYFKFTKQDINETPVYDWTWETLQILLADHLKVKQVRSIGQAGKNTATAEASLSKNDREGSVSQVTMLQTLKEALQSESRALNFDFLSLLTTSYHFLKQLQEDTWQLYCGKLRYLPAAAQLLGWSVNKSAAVVHAIINNPGAADLGSFRCSTRSKACFTNKGHIDIDTSVRRSLEETDWKDKEIKKLNSIWGIASS